MADHLDIALPIVQKDPVSGEFVATAYFENYLYEIISTLGGEGSTIIRDIESSIVDAGNAEYFFALVKQLAIDTAGFIGKIKTANYTAFNKEWVEARNKITIKLPDDPLLDHQAIISNGDGSRIIIDGNGENIKYTSTDTSLAISRKGTSFHFQYFMDNDAGEAYWRVI